MIRKPTAPVQRYNLRSYVRGNPVQRITSPLGPNPQPNVQQAASRQEEEVQGKDKTLEHNWVPHKLYRKRVGVPEEKQDGKVPLKKRKVMIQHLTEKQEGEGRLMKKIITIQQLRVYKSNMPCFILEHPEMPPVMYQALKRHIIRERKEKKQALPSSTEQLRRTSPEVRDEQHHQNRTRIDELLATQAQQEQRIDELLSKETRQEQRIEELFAAKTQQHQRIDELLAIKTEQEQLVDELVITQSQQQQQATEQQRIDKLQREIRDMTRRTQELEDMNICIVCQIRYRKVVFLCGHSVCQRCSNMINVCHMCRRPITARITLY